MWAGPLEAPLTPTPPGLSLLPPLPRVGQQNVDIKLTGQFINEQHCLFRSTTGEAGEGEWGAWGGLLRCCCCTVHRRQLAG